ncbi:MAG: shikimate dehydrogenase [Parvularculaceae bacterium]|nr:shikimate dehydrogenase [Parvularculaceae bacterium]
MSRSRAETPRLAAVLGWPVAHSLSPLIHMTWAAREGANARYDRIAVEPSDEAFQAAIARLRAEGYRGANVTIPHKERALRYADRASAAAEEIGAANMLTFGEDGVTAANSDAAALRAIILDLDPLPRSALVLGAGGAARGALWALKSASVAQIALTNRTKARAEAIAAIADARVIDWRDRNDALATSEFVINATSLGMTGEPALGLDLARLPKTAAVFDAVYAPLETALLRAAAANGLKAIDGLEMLMRQAVPGYLAWLGSRAEIDADLRARLETALAARRE